MKAFGGRPELQRIVLKACAYEPEDRYASAPETLEADKSGRAERMIRTAGYFRRGNGAVDGATVGGNMDYKVLARQYPQLLLPIEHGISDTPLYRNTVLRGMEISGEPLFNGSAEDAYSVEHTPVGEIGIITLGNREDFEHALCALAYRCEPRPISPSIGAQYIGGLINWGKIRNHKKEYLEKGGTNWSTEFRIFTADKANYTDSLIVLSTGFYSNVLPEKVGLSPDAWKKSSMILRKNHELTHFIYRKEYPGDVDSIRDEVLADYIGIRCALGHYDSKLAKTLLGIDCGSVTEDARIRQYVSQDILAQAVADACFWIGTLAALP